MLEHGPRGLEHHVYAGNLIIHVPDIPILAL